MIFFFHNNRLIVNADFAFVKRFTKTVNNLIMTKNFLIKAENKIIKQKSAIIYKPEIIVFKLIPKIKPKITVKNCFVLKYYGVILAWGNRYSDTINEIVANNKDRFEFDTYRYHSNKKLDDEIYFVCPNCKRNLTSIDIYLKKSRLVIFNLKKRTFNYPWNEDGDQLTCNNCYTTFSRDLSFLILKYLYDVRKYKKD